jgi:hypothetical protein
MKTTDERVVLQNQTPKPTCLIFKQRPDADGYGGEMELWSDQIVEPGVNILSNQGMLLFPDDKAKQREYVRALEITNVISRRDFKGAWDEDRERKNNQTYYTVRVKPLSA